MKISDLKYLFPRMKYSTHTPKYMGYPENYFMNRPPIKGLKPTVLEKSPKEDSLYVDNKPKAFGDAIIGGLRRKPGKGGKIFM